MNAGVITVSDSCHSGLAEDRSGPVLKGLIASAFQVPEESVKTALVPDLENEIRAQLLQWADVDQLDLIITTGGTGFAPRDVTPEATKSILQKEAPGLACAMLLTSLQSTHMAMLSRPACGIRGKTLIVNMPGSLNGVKECFKTIQPALPHAMDLLGGKVKSIKETHDYIAKSAKNETPPKVNSSGESGEAPNVGGPAKHTCSHSQVDVSKVAHRARESPYPLISVDKAIETVMSHAIECGSESLNFNKAFGRMLAEDVYAREPLPPFSASIKDGYAVIAADGKGPRAVMAEAIAGSVSHSQIIPGFCARINTGAPVPPGADAVVQVEDTALLKDAEEGMVEVEIEIKKEPKLGQDIRPVGSDIREGELVLKQGQRLGAAELGLLATVGVTEVLCYRQPVVGVMSTGNELLEPNYALEPGKIRDANRTTLTNAIRAEGFTVLDFGIARDTTESLFEKLPSALDQVDVLVTSGGVSMGDKDLIKEILQVDFSAEIHFARVFMKPGKPTTFATLTSPGGLRKLFFGLPGNPVSALVTCNLYVLPALRKMAGKPEPNKPVIQARLANGVKLDPRPEYHRCVVSWEPGNPVPLATSTGNQISSRLLSMKQANALLLLPPRSTDKMELMEGDVVPCMLLHV